jgi:hypothetical protein
VVAYRPEEREVAVSKRVLLVTGIVALGALAVVLAVRFLGNAAPTEEGPSDPSQVTTKAPAPEPISTAAPGVGGRDPLPVTPEPLPGMAGKATRPPRSIDKASDYDMDARTFLLTRVNSAKLGTPPGEWQVGPFGGFDAATLEVPPKEAFLQRVQIAQQIAVELKKQKILTKASPLFAPARGITGGDKEIQGEVLIPVLDGSRVAAPLKLRHVDAGKVFSTDAIENERMNTSQHPEGWTTRALDGVRAAGGALNDSAVVYFRFVDAEPWTSAKPLINILVVVP